MASVIRVTNSVWCAFIWEKYSHFSLKLHNKSLKNALKSVQKYFSAVKIHLLTHQIHVVFGYFLDFNCFRVDFVIPCGSGTTFQEISHNSRIILH